MWEHDSTQWEFFLPLQVEAWILRYDNEDVAEPFSFAIDRKKVR